MRRWDPDLIAGVLAVVLCLATAVPVAVLQLLGEDVSVGPGWVWWLGFAGFLIAMGATAALSESPYQGRALWSFAAQVVLGFAAVLLLADGVGFTIIILIFTAALSCYVVPRWSTVVVVAANTVVIAFATWSGGGWFEPGVTTVFYLLIQVVSVLYVVTQQRAEKARSDLTAAHIQLRAASALLAESSRSAERLRIARDLHDVLGHQLSALALELEVASHQAAPPAAEHVQRARGIAKDLLSDVRGTVGDLRGEGADLRATLEELVRDIPAPRVRLSVADGAEGDGRQTAALVRCVQEIVTNAIRHARGARTVWIEDTRGEDGGRVVDARGDGWETTELRVGNGLRGIRERVEELGGRAQFASESGFHVVLQVRATWPHRRFEWSLPTTRPWYVVASGVCWNSV